MGVEEDSFSIKKLLNLCRSQLPEDEFGSLNLALQSIAKRLKYCEYHYQEHLKHSTPSQLLKERSGPSYNDITRIFYEANFLAFLNNIHCIIDAVPYALNIIFRVSRKGSIDDNVDWKDEHINRYSEYKTLYPALKEIRHSKEFEKIRTLSNRSKHKHLIPIFNNTESLTIGGFRYKDKDKEKTAHPVRADEFMRECHEELIPLTIKLFNTVIELKESEKRS